MHFQQCSFALRVDVVSVAEACSRAPSQDNKINETPAASKFDTTCLSDDRNQILKMQKATMAAEFKKLPLDRMIDVYLCSVVSSDDYKYDVLLDALGEKFGPNIGVFLERLKQETSDRAVVGLLIFFIGYQVDEIQNDPHNTRGWNPDTNPFYPIETARLLVQKAAGVANPRIRNELLGWLILHLPKKEAEPWEAKRQKEMEIAGENKQRNGCQ